MVNSLFVLYGASSKSVKEQLIKLLTWMWLTWLVESILADDQNYAGCDPWIFGFYFSVWLYHMTFQYNRYIAGIFPHLSYNRAMPRGKEHFHLPPCTRKNGRKRTLKISRSSGAVIMEMVVPVELGRMGGATSIGLIETIVESRMAPVASIYASKCAKLAMLFTLKYWTFLMNEWT